MEIALEQVLVLLWGLTGACYWYIEHPLKHTVPTRNGTLVRETEGYWDENCRNKMHRQLAKESFEMRKTDNFRVALRRFLDKLGFFEHIGFLAAMVLSVEAAYILSDRNNVLFQSMSWQLLVAYVAGNHFLYAVHHLAGSLKPVLSAESSATLKALAGVGGMLKEEEECHSWTRYLWNFSEHRLADVAIHLGHAFRRPLRIDHWLCLVLHCIKYSDRKIPKVLKTPLGYGSGKLSLDDAIDCFAHSYSGLQLLGPWGMFLAIFLTELQRWLLKIEVAAHHQDPVLHSPASMKDLAAAAAAAAQMEQKAD